MGVSQCPTSTALPGQRHRECHSQRRTDLDTVTGKFGKQSPAQCIPAQRQLWQQREDMLIGSKRQWGGRQCHTVNFVGTRTMVPTHKVTSSALGHEREDIHSHGHAEGTGTCLSPRATTLLGQEGEGQKTFP